MTTADEQDLASDLESAVRAVPGVTNVFRSGTIVRKLADAAATLIGIADADAPLVRVEQRDDGLRVEIAIGVEAVAGAIETVPLAYAAAAAVLAQRGIDASQIHVTVVHVDDTSTEVGTDAGSG